MTDKGSCSLCYPDLTLITSESCIEYRFYDAEDELGNCARLAHELMGDLNHGINAFYDWNILLDEQGGPNHAGNWCYAAFMYDRTENKLNKNLLQKYYWHFSHFIKPGAVRIGLTKYSDKLEATAFRNPDGSIAVVLFNGGEEPLAVNLRMNGQVAEFAVKEKTIATGIVNQN